MKVAEDQKLPIYPEVIQAQLVKIGLSAAQASKEMGFSEPYLSLCFRRRWVPRYATRLIKIRLGLDYEQYAKQDEPEAVEEKVESPETSEVLDLVLEELRAIRAELQNIRKEFE